MARATKRLSVRKVQTIKNAGYHADGDGLYLVVDPSGAKRWAFIYHWLTKRREMGLGGMDLKEAREAAAEARRQIRVGIDPIAARRSSRDARAAVPTFEIIAAEVIAVEKRKSTNDKVRYQWEHLLGPSYCDAILKKPITEITTLDVAEVLRPVWWSKPETGRKLLVRLRRVFNHARVHLRDRHDIIMRPNPTDWDDLHARGFEHISELSRGRQPSLDYEQAPKFLASLHHRTGIAAKALEVTLLTALRSGEVIEAKWNEIDLDSKTWIVPIRRMKDKKTRTETHRAPLSVQVVEILKALPRLGEFVFPGAKRGKPLSNAAMGNVMDDINLVTSGTPRWIDSENGRPIVPHGLRATFRTWGEEKGFNPDLLEEALAHKVGNKVQRAYRRTDVFERRQKIMQAWADFCHGLPVGKASQILDE